MSSSLEQLKQPKDVAEFVANQILSTLAKALKKRDRASIVLTGGRVGILTLKTLSQHKDLDIVDWSAVDFWWGDERYLDSDDSERNDVQAQNALLNSLDISPSQLHSFPAKNNSKDLTAALKEFQKTLSTHFGSKKPAFDICLLGVGPDGHVASLFPGHDSLDVDDELVIAENASPKPPAERLSFTFELINSATDIYLVVAGEDKAEAVVAAHTNASKDLIPAVGVKAKKKTQWVVDEAAYSLLKNFEA